MANELPKRMKLHDYVERVFKGGGISTHIFDRLCKLIDEAMDEAERTPYTVTNLDVPAGPIRQEDTKQ